MAVAAAAAAALLFTAGPAAADPDGTDTTNSDEQCQGEQKSDEQNPDEQKSDEQCQGVPGTQDSPNLAGLGSPRLAGTYSITGQYAGATHTATTHFSSSCGGCNATGGPNGGTWVWTGGTWEHTYAGGCGPVVDTYTPVAVVDGYAQEVAGVVVGVCGMTQPGQVMLSRIGP